MPLASHFSVLSSSVLMIAKAIDSYGCDSRELFHRAAIPTAATAVNCFTVPVSIMIA
jgi:hypothetical protein